jgi:hypothetical protein
MSVTDGKASAMAQALGRGPTMKPEHLGVVTLTGALVLTNQYRDVLKLDPGGDHRDVTLPAEETSNGRHLRIINAADAAENLVVKNDAAATLVTINQNEQAELWCDGTTWHLLCVSTIALA